ncbi:MAG: class I SAM-dependent methyltransferase family protein [Candidatus Methanoperedens sp.]|nr:class I SAM-dependent methyltransferase family protein [Candidatus Methanoperedens sp.]MCZ7371293.1 class I SAM-dependent methyltransferase family protein [Candidatus Methanoperedens sp.]
MSLRDILKDKLPEKKLSLLPKGFEVIGDIAIINIPLQLEDEKHLIAQALVSHRRGVMVVLRKTNKLHGTKRVGDFEILLGDRTTTVHRENGCDFHVDIARTYFSGKMYFERKRIAELVRNGEDVLVLFCGAGPFLIPIAKTRNVNIIGIENNPLACTFCKKNTELNKVDADIILGDANSINLIFRKDFDRIVMPTPYGQDYFLSLARFILKPEGTIHFYTFKKDFEIAHFKRLLEEKGWRVRSYRNCGGVAPRVNRYVFDMQMI